MDFRKHAAAMKISVKKNPKDAARVIFVGTGVSLLAAISAHGWMANSIFSWADQSAGVLAAGTEIAILVAGTGFAVYSVKSGKLERLLDWIDGDEYDEPDKSVESKHGDGKVAVTVPVIVGETTDVRPLMTPISSPVVQTAQTVVSQPDYSPYENLMRAMVKGVTHWMLPSTSGSGKTVLMHDFLQRIVKKGGVYFALDAKKEGDPALKWPDAKAVIRDPKDFRKALEFIVSLMEKRQADSAKTYDPVYVVIDEFADLSKADDSLIDDVIVVLLQKARSSNIKLIFMTQTQSAKFNGLDGYTDLLNSLTVTTMWVEVGSDVDEVTGVIRGDERFICSAKISSNGQLSKTGTPVLIPRLPDPWMSVPMPHKDDTTDLGTAFVTRTGIAPVDRTPANSAPHQSLPAQASEGSRVRTRQASGDNRGDEFPTAKGFQSSENPAVSGYNRGAGQAMMMTGNDCVTAPPHYDGADRMTNEFSQSSTQAYYGGAEMYQSGGAVTQSAPPLCATENERDDVPVTAVNADGVAKNIVTTVADVAVKIAQIATQTTGTPLDERDLAEVAAVGSAVMRLVGGGDGVSFRAVQELAFGSYNSRKNGALSEIIEFLGVGRGE